MSFNDTEKIIPFPSEHRADSRRVLKIREVALALNVTSATVRRLARRGYFQPCRGLRHLLIPIEQVEAFLARRSPMIAAYKKYVSPTPLATGHHGGRHPSGTGHAYGDAKAFDDEQPDNETSSVSATAAPPPNTAMAPVVSADAGQVWVNTKSGVIWKPGSAFYGKTKVGKYMSESDALAAGYHEAK